MDYIIGVDAGGTKTEASAYDLEDNKIACSISGPGNPAIDFDIAKSNIKEAISQCMLSLKEQCQGGVCRCIYLGAAGIEVGDKKELLESFLRDTFRCEIICLHDSELAHAAVLKGEDGIITISGTGSVSYGVYNGKTDKTGGWGHVLGDEGSGYWIGLTALKQMTMERDLGIRPSELSQKIMSHLRVDSVDEMKEFVHAAGKFEIAGVAAVVADLARDGDSQASDILINAGNELAHMTQKLYKKLEMSGIVSVGISGGILRNVDQVREQFRVCLERDLSRVRILDEDISPTKGACYLFRQNQEELTCKND